MKLSKRLQTVIDKVPVCKCVADIGTDHAYIPIYLIKNKICQHAVASDIKPGPISIAKTNINKNNLDEFIETRISDGLKSYKANEADTVIIAGMGGELIREILNNSPEICSTINYFILQPMTAHEELREWLYNNGYVISDESLIKEDNKLYTVMLCRHGNEKIDSVYYDIGIKLIKNNDPLLQEYIEKKVNEMEKIIKSVKNKDSQGTKSRMQGCKEKLDIYNKLLNTL